MQNAEHEVEERVIGSTAENRVDLNLLEHVPERGLGLAAVSALKRQAEIRELLDRLGMDAKRAGGVYQTRFREVIQGDWGVWDRLVKMVRSGVQNDTIAYGRTKWPELMSELERVAELRKGRSGAADDGGTTMRSCLTFTQKILVCLRRIALPAAIDAFDRPENDTRCVRFMRKLGQTVPKEDVSDPTRSRALHYEALRLMGLKLADGASLKTAAEREAADLLAWLSEQDEIQAHMKVPKFGEGLTAQQMKESLATQLVTSGAEDRTIERVVGVTSRKARALALKAEQRAKGGKESRERKLSVSGKRELMDLGEARGRRELAQQMSRSNTAVGSWIGKADDLEVRVTANEVRYVTADLDEAKQVVDWLREASGPGAKALRVVMTRKDDQFLSEGFLQAARKTLDLREDQVVMGTFTWRADAERVAKARGQIVMSIEVAEPEAAGRLRGMYMLAREMCKRRAMTPAALLDVDRAAWSDALGEQEQEVVEEGRA